MNILTALAIPLAAGLIYGIPSTPTPVVSSVAPGGAAEVAGLRPADRIISFNGTPNPDWDTISGDALLSPNEPLPIVVDRNGQQLNLTIKPKPLTIDGETAGDLEFIPDYGHVLVVIADVSPGSPADHAGVQAADRIAAIGGQTAISSEQVIQYIRAHKTEPLPMDVDRQGKPLKVTVTIPPGEQGVEKKIKERVEKWRAQFENVRKSGNA